MFSDVYLFLTVKEIDFISGLYMVYQLRMYACMYALGNIYLGLVLDRLPSITLFGLHYCVICCVVETKYKCGGGIL